MNTEGLYMTKTMTAKKKPKLGSGDRFKDIESKAKKSGASNPGAVAYMAGAKKYGEAKMHKMAMAGKKRRAK